jgi:hypothetical protein
VTGKFVCRFCLVPIEPCPYPEHQDAQEGVPGYCYGWVHQNNKTHKGHPDNPHSAQPVVA